MCTGCRYGLLVIALVMVLAGACHHRAHDGDGAGGAMRATATIEPRSGSQVRGTASFVARSNEVRLEVTLEGVEPGVHAVHIHEKGDCSAPDATSAGDHWNPTTQPHGAWGHDGFHLGDIGNVTVGADGRGKITLETDRWSIGTGAANDVLNHSIVVHAQPDDFTTQPSGAAGARIGCGVIRRG